MNPDARPSISRPLRLSPAAFLCVHLWLLASATPLAAQPCGGFDECTTSPMCMPDGTCQGTPVQNGTACNDDNPCTASDACLGGECVGNPGPMENQPCETEFGLCALDSLCHMGLCGAFKSCPDADGNKCTLEICNPETGECDFAFPVTCMGPCSTGTCRASDGACINPTPRANGFPCSDGNSCTLVDQCQGGVCVGGGISPGPTSTRTPSPGAGTATRTPTRTPTGLLPATQTVTRTATRTVTAAAACYGDCDANGVVNGTDLTRLRSTLLRCGPCAGAPGAPAGGCAAFANGCVAADYDHDGCLRASDLTRVVANVLEDPSGCADSGPGAATVTRRSAGTLQSTTSVLLLLPRVVSAILGPASVLGGGQGGGAAVVFDVPITCPGSGGGSLKCEQDFFPSFTAPLYTATLSQCTVNLNNRTVRIDGVLTAEGIPGDICGALSSPLVVASDGLVIEESGTAGSLTATLDDFSALVSLSGDDDECFYTTFAMEPSGTIAVVTESSGGAPISSSQITFGSGSTVELIVAQYGEGCAPVVYAIGLEGDVSLLSGGATLAATYTDYVMTNDATGGGNVLTLAGSIASSCLGGSVTVDTESAITQAAGLSCASAGRVVVAHTGGTDALLYGSVAIDQGNDGDIDETYPTCLDPALYVCP